MLFPIDANINAKQLSDPEPHPEPHQANIKSTQYEPRTQAQLAEPQEEM